MREIDRSDIRNTLYITLQKNYIALLAQRGAQFETIVRVLLDPKTAPPRMKFMYVSLPRDTESEDGFEDLFLKRLLTAISHLPGETALIEHVKQSETNCPASYTTTSRIREVLDTLGRETSNVLVIILPTSAQVAHKPLKKLLTMLREYSDQREIYGTEGDKLRFMAVGDAHLWDLCYQNTPELSPFNIAHRMLLEDFSPQELQKIGLAKDAVAASRLHTLTGGVPLLIEEITERKDDSVQDLVPYFRCLQNDWNALAPESKEALKLVATGSLVFPECENDEHIPIIAAPWRDMFWKGFLCLRLYCLTWRSPIHYMFVRRLVNDKENYSVSLAINIGHQETIACLEKATQKGSYGEYRDEILRETQVLASQLSLPEIYIVLEAMIHQENNENIVKRCQQIAEETDQDWLKELGREARKHKGVLDSFLIKTLLDRAKQILDSPYNIFLNQKEENENTTALEYRSNENQITPTKQVDFAIITIREDEFEAVLQRFPHKPQKGPSGRTYGISQIKTQSRQNCTVAIVRCDEQGTDTAQQITNHVISDLDPQMLLVVGIAGGVPHDDFTLGDVIISSRIDNFNLSKRHEDGREKFDMRSGIHPVISDIAANLRLYHAELAGWNTEASITLSRPTVNLAQFNKNTFKKKITANVDKDVASWYKDLQSSITSHFGSKRVPTFKTGRIASSNNLVRNIDILVQWLRDDRSILAVEMESAGVYQATQGIHQQYPVMAIRGISDIIGLDRDNQWTKYACQTAAAFAYAFITAGIVPPKSPTRD